MDEIEGKEQTMSRYIDADELAKRAADSNKSAGLHTEDYRKFKKWIRSAPSIDIVRCRECKYFWKYSDLPTKCVFHLSLVSADDFCSYGDKLND